MKICVILTEKSGERIDEAMAQKIHIREGTFLKESAGGILLGNRCRSCDQVFFPKVSLCMKCLSHELEEVRLSQTGILYSYTVSYMPSTHIQAPYVIGYIDMPEGVRIFAPLKTSNKPLEIGMEMKVVIETLWQEGDKKIIGYKFSPK